MSTTVFWLREPSGLWHPSLHTHPEAMKCQELMRFLTVCELKGSSPCKGVSSVSSTPCALREVKHHRCLPALPSANPPVPPSPALRTFSVYLQPPNCSPSSERTELQNDPCSPCNTEISRLLSHNPTKHLNFFRRVHCLQSPRFPLSSPPPEKLLGKTLL